MKAAAWPAWLPDLATGLCDCARWSFRRVQGGRLVSVHKANGGGGGVARRWPACAPTVRGRPRAGMVWELERRRGRCGHCRRSPLSAAWPASGWVGVVVVVVR